MKLQGIELPFGRTKKTSKLVILVTILILILFTIIPLYCSILVAYPSTPSFLFKKTSTSSESSSSYNYYEAKTKDSISSEPPRPRCDLFSGEWVPNPEVPYYTNTTCRAIHEHQNCMKYGRPDSDYMKWRWKPDGCDLPIFNPAHFLELVRDKSLAFVGDSVGRNQMQSLICLLSRVEDPVDVSYTKDDDLFIRWKYLTYNFTMATFWTPHLVKSKQEADSSNGTGIIFNLHLDEFDENWTTKIYEFDYLIISAGHWFFSSCVFYENKQIVGCHNCRLDNVTELPMYYGYRKAIRTAFKAINSFKNKYKGITYLRTFAPSHFENGLWNKGGNCTRRRPFRRNETVLDGPNLEIYLTQIEEFKVAERQGNNKFRLLDTTQLMLLRPDGHPSSYGHWADQNGTFYNDCVHWCLPGPIDSWADFLLQMLKMEEDGRSIHANNRRPHSPHV